MLLGHQQQQVVVPYFDLLLLVLDLSLGSLPELLVVALLPLRPHPLPLLVLLVVLVVAALLLGVVVVDLCPL
jgi:hypothetical protein